MDRFRAIDAFVGAMRRCIAAGPCVREGVYKTVEVRPWAWGLGTPKEGS